MSRFKSLRQAQRFLFLHGQVGNLFYAGRYKNQAESIRNNLRAAFQSWDNVALQN